MSAASSWEGAPWVSFDHVWGCLQANGWLRPAKLRTLPDQNSAHLLKLTFEEQGGEVDEMVYDSLLDWLDRKSTWLEHHLRPSWRKRWQHGVPTFTRTCRRQGADDKRTP